MEFQNPWAFLLFIPVCALIYLKIRHNKASTIRFPLTSSISTLEQSFRQKFIWLIPFLQFFIMINLVIIIAKPRKGLEQTKTLKKGIAIEMIIDSSSSMDITMQHDNSSTSRFEIAKQVFKEFVRGNNNNLTGRTNDIIGMITFARYADTVCPLTLDHDSLIHFLNELKIENRPNEDGTAIGDALLLGAGRLKTVEETLIKSMEEDDPEYRIKNKIIILLTDGENNCGRYMPRHGALLAKKWGIKIYTIGFGNQMEIRTIKTKNGLERVNVTSGFNARTLAMISQKTGGIFRIAKDADALREIYKEINRLEKSEIRSLSYLDHKELYIPFAYFTLALISVYVLLSSTFLRKIP